MTEDSRAYTVDECKEQIFASIVRLFRYWRDVPVDQLMPGNSELEGRMSGFLHSLLVQVSGGGDLPGLNVTVDPDYAEQEEDLPSGAKRWWPADVNLRDEIWHEVFPWDELMNLDAAKASVDAAIAASGGPPTWEEDK